MSDFKIGDKVVIREWDDLKAEFKATVYKEGIDLLNGVIFANNMYHLCGRTATIIDINGTDVLLDFDDKSGDINWKFTIEMIKPFTPKKYLSREKLIQIGYKENAFRNGKSQWVKCQDLIKILIFTKRSEYLYSGVNLKCFLHEKEDLKYVAQALDQLEFDLDALGIPKELRRR